MSIVNKTTASLAAAGAIAGAAANPNNADAGIIGGHIGVGVGFSAGIGINAGIVVAPPVVEVIAAAPEVVVAPPVPNALFMRTPSGAFVPMTADVEVAPPVVYQQGPAGFVAFTPTPEIVFGFNAGILVATPPVVVIGGPVVVFGGGAVLDIGGFWNAHRDDRHHYAQRPEIIRQTTIIKEKTVVVEKTAHDHPEKIQRPVNLPREQAFKAPEHKADVHLPPPGNLQAHGDKPGTPLQGGPRGPEKEPGSKVTPPAANHAAAIQQQKAKDKGHQKQ